MFLNDSFPWRGSLEIRLNTNDGQSSNMCFLFKPPWQGTLFTVLIQMMENRQTAVLFLSWFKPPPLPLTATFFTF